MLERRYCQWCGKWDECDAIWSEPDHSDYSWFCKACQRNPEAMAERGRKPVGEEDR